MARPDHDNVLRPLIRRVAASRLPRRYWLGTASHQCVNVGSWFVRSVWI